MFSSVQKIFPYCKIVFVLLDGFLDKNVTFEEAKMFLQYFTLFCITLMLFSFFAPPSLHSCVERIETVFHSRRPHPTLTAIFRIRKSQSELSNHSPTPPPHACLPYLPFSRFEKNLFQTHSLV